MRGGGCPWKSINGHPFSSLLTPLKPYFGTCILFGPFSWILAKFEPNYLNGCFRSLSCSIVVVFWALFEEHWGPFEICTCMQVLQVVATNLVEFCWVLFNLFIFVLILEYTPFCTLAMPLRGASSAISS